MQDALASTPRFDSHIPTPQQDDRLGAPPEGPRWELRAEENTRRPLSLADVASVKQNKSQNQEESDKEGIFTVPVTGRGRIGLLRKTGPKWQNSEADDER